MVDGDDAGRPRNSAVMVIAAVAEAHRCLIVTDNERDFVGLNYLNPMRAGSAT
jgi:predicted nucleic acid-binding protein